MSQYKKFGELPNTENETRQAQAQQQAQAQAQQQAQQEAEQQKDEIKERMEQEEPQPQRDNDLPYFNLENKEEFQEYLKKYRVVVVDVWAEWCQPCKRIAPRFEALAEKYKNNPYMIFVKDDIDNDATYHRELCSSIPTFFIYADGNKNARQFPGTEFDRFAQLVDKFNERLMPKHYAN